MQITRQADYAVRAMVYLAQLGAERRAATSQIAQEKQIPPSFSGEDRVTIIGCRPFTNFARRSRWGLAGSFSG